MTNFHRSLLNGYLSHFAFNLEQYFIISVFSNLLPIFLIYSECENFHFFCFPKKGSIFQVRSVYQFRHILRSEERRVGKECSEPCRSRWSPYHQKKKKKKKEKKKKKKKVKVLTLRVNQKNRKKIGKYGNNKILFEVESKMTEISVQKRSMEICHNIEKFLEN
eukprot:TRINITY_DN2126_c0_g1_i2.p1 TRINITY_DN2126_c0_g1~~TRINITY_DN2126_c0_g1_i2.p1  ORF type:complete len:163 (-),score=4.07 TRINITY_DN2126_c0_g1_i2:331-819(-)